MPGSFSQSGSPETSTRSTALHPWRNYLVGKGMRIGPTTRAVFGCFKRTDNLTTYTAYPTHCDLAHEIGTADNAYDFAIFNDRYPPNALVGKQMLNLLNFGVGADTYHASCHNFFNSTPLFGNQVVLGDETYQHTLSVNNR